MQKWSKGEIGVMWLGIGAACVAVSAGFSGVPAVIFIVVGVLGLGYGATLAWQGIRAKREADPDDAATSGSPGAPHDDSPST